MIPAKYSTLEESGELRSAVKNRTAHLLARYGNGYVVPSIIFWSPFDCHSLGDGTCSDPREPVSNIWSDSHYHSKTYR